MKAEVIVAAMLALVCLGCEKPRNDMDACIAQCVASVVRSEALGLNGYREGEAFLDVCASMTNVRQRIDGLTRFADVLLSERLDDDGYRQWDRSLSAIPSLVRSICTSLAWSGTEPEIIYDIRLRLLSWHCRQLELLQAKRPLESERPHDVDLISWQSCRTRVESSRRMTEKMIESRFAVETRGLPEERRAAIKKRIEAVFGRPMTTFASARREQDGMKTKEMK